MAAHRHAADQTAQAQPVLLLAPDPAVPAAGAGATGGGSGRDAHAVAYAAARAGRHSEAAAVAAHQEQLALREGGPGSGQALHWGEVRADLAHLAGDYPGATRGWLRAAARSWPTYANASPARPEPSPTSTTGCTPPPRPLPRIAEPRARRGQRFDAPGVTGAAGRRWVGEGGGR